MQRLILVDWDGVLEYLNPLKTDFHHQTIKDAFSDTCQTFSIQNKEINWQEVFSATWGTTELGLVRYLASKIGLADSQFENFAATFYHNRAKKYEKLKKENQLFPSLNLRLIAEIKNLAQNPDNKIFLFTGNPENVALVRFPAEILEIFRDSKSGRIRGFFGDRAASKSELLQLALKEAQKDFGFKPQKTNEGRFVNVACFDDSPLAIIEALLFGARALLVSPISFATSEAGRLDNIIFHKLTDTISKLANESRIPDNLAQVLKQRVNRELGPPLGLNSTHLAILDPDVSLLSVWISRDNQLQVADDSLKEGQIKISEKLRFLYAAFEVCGMRVFDWKLFDNLSYNFPSLSETIQKIAEINHCQLPKDWKIRFERAIGDWLDTADQLEPTKSLPWLYNTVLANPHAHYDVVIALSGGHNDQGLSPASVQRVLALAELMNHHQKDEPLVIFSGGCSFAHPDRDDVMFGKKPSEAKIMLDLYQKIAQQVGLKPLEHFVLEEKSTHTAENLIESCRIMMQKGLTPENICLVTSDKSARRSLELADLLINGASCQFTIPIACQVVHSEGNSPTIENKLLEVTRQTLLPLLSNGQIVIDWKKGVFSCQEDVKLSLTDQLRGILQLENTPEDGISSQFYRK